MSGIRYFPYRNIVYFCASFQYRLPYYLSSLPLFHRITFIYQDIAIFNVHTYFIFPLCLFVYSLFLGIYFLYQDIKCFYISFKQISATLSLMLELLSKFCRSTQIMTPRILKNHQLKPVKTSSIISIYLSVLLFNYKHDKFRNFTQLSSKLLHKIKEKDFTDFT